MIGFNKQDKYMVLEKNAIVNNLYILKYDSALLAGTSHKIVNNVFLVKLIDIGTYGGKTHPILLRLIEIKPSFEITKEGVIDSHHQWWNLFSLKHKTVKGDVQLLLKHRKDFFNFIFKESD